MTHQSPNQDMLGFKSQSQSPNPIDNDKWHHQTNYFHLTLTTKHRAVDGDVSTIGCKNEKPNE